MAIKFLEVSAEEAVLSLSKIVEEGYEIKIGMDTEYKQTKQDRGGIDNSSVHELVVKWETKANDWFQRATDELTRIYTSKRHSYEFRESQPSISFQSDAENPKWYSIHRSMGAKLAKLNEFDDFVKREFRIELKYVAGDNYETHGQNSPIQQ